MRREDTSIGGHARRTITTFFIGTGLAKVDGLLSGEVGNIVHRFDLTLGLGWAQDHGVLQ